MTIFYIYNLQTTIIFVDNSDYMGYHESPRYLAQLDAMELYIHLILKVKFNFKASFFFLFFIIFFFFAYVLLPIFFVVVTASSGALCGRIRIGWACCLCSS